MNSQTKEYADNYAANQKSGLTPKEMEIRAFINMASSFNRVKEHWEDEKKNLPEVLEKNRMLWTVIASSMQEKDCPHPLEIKKNILQLAAFVFKRTLELINDPRPEGLDVLINIDMNIARGLSGNAGE